MDYQPPPPQHTDDEDVLALLEGPVSALREQALFLIKCLNKHKSIDVDLWRALADLAGSVCDQIDDVTCVCCMARRQVVKLGRGRGFDAVLCDSCLIEAL
jgi:hypothetical protein